jgi:hypothetical protein
MSHWKTLIRTLLVIIVAGVGVVFLANAVQRDMQMRRELTCQGNLTTIGLALHDYHQTHKHFPPAYLADAQGKPAHSWRVLLLEILDPDLYKLYDFGEPWNGPKNKQLEGKMPGCYSCPSDHQRKQGFHTNYAVIIGPKTVFPGSATTALAAVKDDKTTTLLVVEIGATGVHWMEPRDLDYSSMSFTVDDQMKPSISSAGCRNPGVCFVDGSVRRLKRDVGEETIRAMLTINGGERVERKGIVVE